MTKPANPSTTPLTATPNKAAVPPTLTTPAKQALIIETAEITAENTTALSAATDKYSDYEISVEGKDYYEDALFSSEDELDHALSQTQENKPIEPQQITGSAADSDLDSKAEPNTQPQNQTFTKPAAIDLNDFLSPHSQQQKFQAGRHLFSKEDKQLPYLNKATLHPLSLLPGQLTEPEVFVSTLPVAERAPLPTGKKNAQYYWQFSLILARYQWHKAAIAFNEYFGRSLPTRSIAFDYKALKLKSKSQFAPLLSRQEINKLFTSKGISTEQLLTTASNELNTLAKCALSNGKKQQLADHYGQVLQPLFKAYIDSSNKQPIAIKNQPQTAQVEAIKSITKNIISIYKQLYMSLYQASNLVYGPQRNKANALAFTLIDWLCLEQWLYSAMLTPLPASSIKTINNLFYTQACYEPQQLELAQASLCSESPMSLKQLYIRYQLLLLIDFSTINTRLHAGLIAQLLAAIPQLSLFKLPQKQPQDCHSIPYQHSAVMQFSPAAEAQKVQGLGFDLAQFSASIKAAYQAQLKQLTTQKTNSNKPTGLANFAVHAALYAQLARFSQQHSSAYYSLYQPFKLSLFNGLVDCFNHSHYSYLHNLKSQQKASDIELPQPPKASSCPWSAAVNNDKLLCLQTTEAKLAARLNIGQPVIISLYNEELGQAELQLALVSRIMRSQSQLIDVELSKVANSYTGATIEESLPPHNKALLYRAEGKYYMLTQSLVPSWKGKTLALNLHSEQTAVVCIKALAQDFGQYKLYQLF